MSMYCSYMYMNIEVTLVAIFVIPLTSRYPVLSLSPIGNYPLPLNNCYGPITSSLPRRRAPRPSNASNNESPQLRSAGSSALSTSDMKQFEPE